VFFYFLFCVFCVFLFFVFFVFFLIFLSFSKNTLCPFIDNIEILEGMGHKCEVGVDAEKTDLIKGVELIFIIYPYPLNHRSLSGDLVLNILSNISKKADIGI